MDDDIVFKFVIHMYIRTPRVGVLKYFLMVYLEDQFLSMTKILTKCKCMILLHLTNDVLSCFNDIMTCFTHMYHNHALFIYIPST